MPKYVQGPARCTVGLASCLTLLLVGDAAVGAEEGQCIKQDQCMKQRSVHVSRSGLVAKACLRDVGGRHRLVLKCLPVKALEPRVGLHICCTPLEGSQPLSWAMCQQPLHQILQLLQSTCQPLAKAKLGGAQRTQLSQEHRAIWCPGRLLSRQYRI